MVKISSVLDTEPDITDRPDARAGAAHRGPDRPRRTCRSPTARRTVLHDIEIHVARGRVHRAGRPVGRRQVDARQADRALLRPAATARCASTASTCATCSCAATAASSASCCRTRSCSPARSPTTSASRGPTPPTSEVRAAAAAIGVDRLAARFAEGLDHRVREGGAEPLGRRAPAHLDRPRAPRRPAHPDPRRGHVEHRPADRAPDRARARPAAARPHLDHHRPPARHRPPRESDPGRASTARSSSAAPSASCSPQGARSTSCRCPRPRAPAVGESRPPQIDSRMWGRSPGRRSVRARAR